MTLTKDKIYKNTKEKSKNTKDEEAKRFSSFGFYFIKKQYNKNFRLSLNKTAYIQKLENDLEIVYNIGNGGTNEDKCK